MMHHVIGRSDVFKGAIVDVAFKKMGECVLLLVLSEAVLSDADLAFGVSCPILCFLFSLKVVADGRVAF